MQVGELLQDVARIDSAAAKRQAAATSAAHAARNLTEAEADELVEVRVCVCVVIDCPA